MQSSKFLVHGAVLHLSTNSKKVYGEIHKDFGRFETDEDLEIDGKIKIIETEGKFPIEIPEYAIRDSFVPPESAMYVISNQRFVERKNECIIRIDYEKKEIVAYTRPSYDISQLMHSFLKWMLIKTLEDKNIFFIHGSGVVKEDNSSFFVGHSGFGKTTILVALLQEGFKMITDDTILISDGEVLPFHIRGMIHEDMFQKFPVLKKGLNENSTNFPQQGWFVDLEDIFPVKKGRILPSKLFYAYVWNSRKTKCEEIGKKEMLSKLLQIYLQEFNKSVWFGKDKDVAIRKLFPSYHSFVENVDCYKVFAGRDLSEFLKVIGAIVR